MGDESYPELNDALKLKLDLDLPQHPLSKTVPTVISFLRKCASSHKNLVL